MATIENFILRFKTEGTQGLSAVKGTLKDIASQSAQTGTALDGLVGRLGPLGAAAGAAVLAIGALGMKAVNLADELLDLSAATGIGADQLLNLKQSMVLAGGSSDSFAKASTKLAVSIGEAMGGNDKYQKSFRDLGVFVTDASGKLRDSGDILQDVIKKLAEIDDPAVRAARAVELLGKEAAKIDWTQVKAGRDAVTAEQIAQLGKYRDEIDKLRNTLEVGLLKAFGNLAEAFNKGGLVEGLAALVEQMGKLISYIPGLGFVADIVDKARASRLGERAGGGRGGQGGPTAEELKKYEDSQKPATGGYGGPSEQTLKAIADSRLRIEQSRIEAQKQLELRGQGDINQIEINAKYEVAKAKEEIFSKERLTVAQKEAELAAKVIEINAKRDTDIAKNRLQTTIRVMNEEMAAQQKFNEEMAAYQDKVTAANVTAGSQVKAIRDQTDELQARFTLQQSIIDLGTIDQERQTKIFDAIQQQKQQLAELQRLQDTGFLFETEKKKREQEINDLYRERIGLINKEADVKLTRENDFSAGVKESMKRYEESMTPLKQGQQVADAVFSNMNNAVDRFVENGKFSFKGFATSVVQDLIKIQMRAAATQLFNSVLSTFGFGLPGKANGGPVSAGQAYIVGERGPEVFMPNNAGSIIPNNQIGGGGRAFGGGQSVTYNIQAVDAMSFKQMLARDPSFLHAVAEQGRRTIPATRR